MAWRQISSARWPWFVAIGVVAWIAIRYGWSGYFSESAAESTRPLVEGEYDVVRAVAGDTLLILPAASDSKDSSDLLPSRVKLLAVECPTQAWSSESLDFTREFLRAGRVRIRLEPRRQDKQGVGVAYVYVGEQLLNEELLRAGLARLALQTGDNFSLLRQLKAAQAEAVAAKRGIWAKETPAAELVVEPSASE